MARISKYVEITPEGKYVGHIYTRTLKAEGPDKGKQYVGATTDPKGRDGNWHKKNNKSYGGKKITEAHQTYNDIANDWQTDYIERVLSDTNEELSSKLDEREDWWMDELDTVNNGFNDYKNHERHFSDEHRANLSKGHRDYQTEETKKKISEANKGRVVSDETRKKISESKTGTKHTPEQNAAQSRRMRGIIPTAATEGAKEWVKRNGGGYWKNHPIPQETKNKMKATQQERGTDVIATFPNGHEEEYTTMLDAAKATGHNIGSVDNCVKRGGTTQKGYKFRKK